LVGASRQRPSALLGLLGEGAVGGVEPVEDAGDPLDSGGVVGAGGAREDVGEGHGVGCHGSEGWVGKSDGLR
jgi:hypothetical protein